MPAKIRNSNSMLLLYNLGVRFYFLLVFIASFFNKKAKAWIQGRKNVYFQSFDKSAWFHFASLGEFEQGVPVLSAYRASHPGVPVVITFFSPSGFEIRQNTRLADAVYYLPLDTAANAIKFIGAINPSVAVFTKYEYWYHYFNELHKREIPLYVISGIFRPDQVFFKWYGTLHRRMLGFVKHFFVQDENSKTLLQTIGITNVSVSGDTRFDRVWDNAQQPKTFAIISEFHNEHKMLVAGSTWPEDEALLVELVKANPGWKFILAPHEIRVEKISQLIRLLPEDSAIRYSELLTRNTQSVQTLVIDNVGMLSALYQFGDIAYIGGGFGAGIHNTLEAAAFGLPVIFGPNYQKFREAKDLIDLGAGFTVQNLAELKEAFSSLSSDQARLQRISKQIKGYVRDHTGATGMIMGYINK